MGRNFPSYRSYLQTLIRDVERIKALVKDKRLVNALDDVIDFLMNESGAISASSNYIVTQLILLVAKVLTEVKENARGDHTRC